MFLSKSLSVVSPRAMSTNRSLISVFYDGSGWVDGRSITEKCLDLQDYRLNRNLGISYDQDQCI